MIKKILFLTVFILLFARTVQAAPDRLDSWYNSYNHQYFNDELPQTVVISRHLHDGRFIALTDYAGGYFHIEFNPAYIKAGTTARMVLLHEMCHIRQAVEHDEEFDQHGQHWQSCMKDLARQGAFQDIW